MNTFLLLLAALFVGQTVPTKDVRQIQGIWWSATMPQSAAFVISDSTITYPDLFEEHRYALQGDSLFVHRPDGTIGSLIVKVTADSLVLSTFGQEKTYTRSEPVEPP